MVVGHSPIGADDINGQCSAHRTRTPHVNSRVIAVLIILMSNVETNTNKTSTTRHRPERNRSRLSRARLFQFIDYGKINIV